jgi:hypothetical protein
MSLRTEGPVREAGRALLDRRVPGSDPLRSISAVVAVCSSTAEALVVW